MCDRCAEPSKRGGEHEHGDGEALRRAPEDCLDLAADDRPLDRGANTSAKQHLGQNPDRRL
jgi:hypothetical protein